MEYKYKIRVFTHSLTQPSSSFILLLHSLLLEPGFPQVHNHEPPMAVAATTSWCSTLHLSFYIGTFSFWASREISFFIRYWINDSPHVPFTLINIHSSISPISLMLRVDFLLYLFSVYCWFEYGKFGWFLSINYSRF
jgi:hypothetical protein